MRSSLWRSFCSLGLILCLVSCDIDGGFNIDTDVSFDSVEDFSYTPIFVQGFAPNDFDADGQVRTEAAPLYEMLISGPMNSGQSLSLSYGSLGYPWEAEFIAWLDVNGDAAIGWQGSPGNPAQQPGPGDIVGGPPQLRFTGAQGSNNIQTDFGDPLVFSHAASIPGEVPPTVRIELDTYFSMLDVPADVEMPIVFQADAYRPEDFVSEEPCATCEPLFTFEETHALSTGANNTLIVSAERHAEPIRIWLSGVASDRVILAGSTPALFGEDDATRSRAAIGVPVTLVPVQAP